MPFLTLCNDTNWIVQYVVRRGEQVIARLPGIAPKAQLQVPDTDTYQVTATTIIDGNLYTSAPVQVNGAAGFLAQVRQVPAQGTYEFEVVELASSRPDQLQFQKTSLSPVTFTISRDGVMLQAVMVPDSFQMKTLNIADTYSIYAVINGITTEPVMTHDPAATITAVVDTSTLEAGYFTLVVS